MKMDLLLFLISVFLFNSLAVALEAEVPEPLSVFSAPYRSQLSATFALRTLGASAPLQGQNIETKYYVEDFLRRSGYQADLLEAGLPQGGAGIGGIQMTSYVRLKNTQTICLIAIAATYRETCKDSPAFYETAECIDSKNNVFRFNGRRALTSVGPDAKKYCH